MHVSLQWARHINSPPPWCLFMFIYDRWNVPPTLFGVSSHMRVCVCACVFSQISSIRPDSPHSGVCECILIPTPHTHFDRWRTLVCVCVFLFPGSSICQPLSPHPLMGETLSHPTRCLWTRVCVISWELVLGQSTSPEHVQVAVSLFLVAG